MSLSTALVIPQPVWSRLLVVGQCDLDTAETRKPANTRNAFSAHSFRASAPAPRFRGVTSYLTTTRLLAARTVLAGDVILPPTMAQGDAQVIQAVLAGEVDRYAELVDRYQAQAIRLAFSLLGNAEDAKDASQEAFVNAYRSLSRFRGEAKFSTWLFRIVINECKDVYKRRARQPAAVARVGEPDPDAEGAAGLFVDVDDPGAGPSDQLANRELSRQLTLAIQRLPGRQRTVFLLHHVQGMPLEEVAEVLRCRLGTVKSHLFRATDQLRRQLTPWLAENQITVISKS